MERGVAEFHIILPRGINSILNKSPYQINCLLYACPIICLVISFSLFLRKIPLVGHLRSDWSFEVPQIAKGGRGNGRESPVDFMRLYESFYGQKV